MQVPGAGDAVGRYRLDALLGQGGMGVVYRATDTGLGRTVALKMISGALGIDDDFRSRFRREADILAHLASPHIIHIYDVGEHDDAPFLVTQYVAGGDLAQLLHDRGPLSPQLALQLCAQVADGLSDAHRAGVVHRDVKPGNVLLHDASAPSPHVYLCDFGIAQLASGGMVTGSLAGSWAYLAPERAAGERAAPTSDLYSLGCLLWQCLTGRPPFVGTDAQIAIAHASAATPQLAVESGPDAAALNEVFRRTLAKRPDERYADAATVRDRLQDLGRSASREPLRPPSTPAPPTRPPPPGPPTALPPMAAPATAAPPPAAPPTAPPPPQWQRGQEPAPVARRSRRTPLVVGVVVLALIGGSVTWWALRDDGPEPPPVEQTDPPVETAEGVRGDLDGDGLGDAVAYSYRPEDFADSYSAYTLVNDTDRFRPSRIAMAGDFPAIADIDGDGVDERITMAQLSAGQSAELTVSDRSFTEGSSITYDVPTVTGVVQSSWGDVTGDGLDDLIITAGEAPTIWVLESSGDDLGEPVVWYDGAVGVGTFPVLVPADVDGDDREDLVVFGQDAGGVVALLSQDGGFADPEEVSGPSDYTDVTAADLDGDGADDLVIIDPDAQQLVLATRQGSDWTLEPMSSRSDTDLRAAQMGSTDADGDGADEVLLLSAVDDGVGSTQVKVLTAGDTAGTLDYRGVWGEIRCEVICDFLDAP